MPDPSTKRNTSTCDFLVVGGGVVGLTSAIELAEAGHAVTLVERASGPAAGSSGAAAGIISLLYPWEFPEALQALAADSRKRYPVWCDALAPFADAPGIGWSEQGMVTFDTNAAPPNLKRMTAADLTQRMPAVSPPADTGLWLPDVATLEPRWLAAALAVRAAALGVVMKWGRSVDALWCVQHTIRGVVLAGGDRMAAGAVVVAAGAWSAELLASVDFEVPIRPVRGQVIELTGPPGLLDCVVMHQHRYLLPRADGRIIVGSTAEEVGFDASITDEAEGALKAAAAALVPRTADLPVTAQWAGLRPGSPNGMPLIGPVPDITGLWLNLGHFRNGITLAPGSAALLAAQIAGAAPVVAFLPKP